MLPLGTTIPAFRLPTATGEMVSSDVYNSRPLLVAFICHHCPFVRHIRREFARFTSEFQERGLAIVAINSNDSVAFPEDGPEGMQQESREAGYTFPYLFDEGQHVARAYGPTRTFHVFALDRERRLQYTGRFDDARVAASVTTHDLANALDDMLAGQPVRVAQTKAFGCSLDIL